MSKVQGTGRTWIALAGTSLVRGLLLFGVWWVLTLGQPSAGTVGVAVAALVALLSLRLFPPSGFVLNPLGLLYFLVYFLSRSVVAGLDVTRRLLSPSLPVNPGEITVRLALPAGSPRWLLANSLSLMPGTLSVLLDGDRLILHCLDIREAVENDVRRTERCVARVFFQRRGGHGGSGQ